MHARHWLENAARVRDVAAVVIYATAVILVLATPVLAMTLLLVALDRVFGVGIFDPDRGGDPLLFQHLFWFYSHPAVYIMILPGMRLASSGSRHRRRPSTTSKRRRW